MASYFIQYLYSFLKIMRKKQNYSIINYFITFSLFTIFTLIYYAISFIHRYVKTK